MSEILACKLMTEAHENPQKYEGKQYEVVDGSPLYSAGCDFTECKVHSGRLEALNNAGTFAVYSDTVLSEIPRPVPFMNATKIFISGKTVICESKEFGKRKYTKKTKGARFEEEDGIPVSAYEILYGKWYVEE